MITEHDLKDWDYDQLRTAVTKVQHEHDKKSDDYLREFIDHIETLSKSCDAKIAAVIDPAFWKTIIKEKDVNENNQSS